MRILIILLAICLILISCTKEASFERPAQGKKYYRVMQVDLDGKVTYSNIIK